MFWPESDVDIHSTSETEVAVYDQEFSVISQICEPEERQTEGGHETTNRQAAICQDSINTSSTMT
jgi:hypothetical protein